MAKKSKNIVKRMYKITGTFTEYKRTAKFAPELIAEGFADGVSMEQGNLLKQYFDDPTSQDVDPATNINSDKFSMLASGYESPSTDIKTE